MNKFKRPFGTKVDFSVAGNKGLRMGQEWEIRDAVVNSPFEIINQSPLPG
jgi:hypothetical protein